MQSALERFPTVFAALADPTRLRIIGLLTNGEVCVCDLYEALQMPQPKVSRHLAYLRRAGLVSTNKRGLWVYYRLAEDEATGTVLTAVRDALGSSKAVQRDVARLRKRCCAAV